MNKRQAQRLLRAAKAVEESEVPKAFTMECFIRGDACDVAVEKAIEKGWCGTPACVLGHFASRPDLQRLLTIKYDDCPSSVDYDAPSVDYDDPSLRFNLYYRDDTEFDFFGDVNNDYFGVNHLQFEALFGTHGCNNAKTPKEAAKFIRNFVRKQYGSLPSI